MDPKTGGILAMANYPSYDPKNYVEYGDEFFKNPIISDSFEPGSIFKPIVMAAGIDAGVVEPDTVCDACSGPFKVDKYFIETWDNKYQANATMTDVIVHSNNVGMVYVGNKLGMDKLYEYITKFGIGSPTGIDLQGESAPTLRERRQWNIVDQATATFGQGIATTPIQMLKAIGIIANQGRDVSPKVVRELSRDGWSSEVSQGSTKQIISPEAASKMTQMMIAAVRAGEAKWASPKGYEIAGKTGTAQIAVSGHYDAEKTNASFVGFAPAYDPKFVMLVTLKEPQSSPWASETAAPLWFDIAKLMFAYMGIQPQN
jgi:cell division protein FtsI (penicillin-binding protein 3)/stage V sporulation protein D (sporulation-specific penicillin-binding protein)